MAPAATRLGLFFDGLMAAAVLFAVTLVPGFFNIFAAQSFEPDKVLLVRSLSLIGLFALVCRNIERGGWVRTGAGGVSGFLAQPLVAPLLLLCAVNAVSTAFSVLPETSFWGGYERRQGLYSLLSYAIMFFVLTESLQGERGIRRLVDAIILAGVPVAAYGIVQAFGGSASGSGALSLRVASTFGNPIFLSAYLIMVFPLTLARLIESCLSLYRRQDRGVQGLIPAAFYALLAMLQLFTFVLTQSRGPLFGFVAGLGVFMLGGLLMLAKGDGGTVRLTAQDAGKALLFAVLSMPVGALPAYIFFLIRKKGYRWLWLSLVFQGLAAMFLVVLLVAGGGEAAKKGIPYAGRLGTLFDLQSDTVKVRLLIWDGTVRLVKSSPVRSVIGQGPDTMKYVWGRFGSPELAFLESRDATADRSHNETLDTLVNSGLAGLAAYLWFIVAVFYYGLRWLGLLVLKRDKIIFAACVAAGGLAGFFLPRLVGATPNLSFIGLPLGLVGGLVASMAVTGLVSTAPAGVGLKTGKQLLLLALLAALVAHFVETHSGITVAATRLFLFLFAGLMVLVAGQGGEGAAKPLQGGTPVAAQASREKKGPPRQGLPSAGWKDTAFYSTLMMGLLFSLAFPNVINPQGEGDSLTVLGRAFSRIYVGELVTDSYGILIVLATALSAGAFFLRQDLREGAGSSTWYLNALVFLVSSAVVTIVLLLIETTFVQPGSDPGKVIGFYVTVVMILLATLAFVLAGPGTVPVLSRKGWWWLYPVLAVLTVWWIAESNVAPARADIYQKLGKSAERRQDVRGSLLWYGRATEADPGESQYLGSLSKAIFDGARSAPGVQERRALMEKSLFTLEKAHGTNPLSVDYLANLGFVNAALAASEPSPELRTMRIERSNTYFERAITQNPYRAAVYNLWAAAYLQRGDYDGALEKLKVSLKIDDRFSPTHRLLGEIQARRGKHDEALPAFKEAVAKDEKNVDAMLAAAHSLYRQGKLDEAIKLASKAERLNSNNPNAHMLLNILYFKAGRLDDALREGLAVLKIAPRHLNAQRNVGVTYARLGRYDEAAKHLEEALKLAPEQEKPAIRRQLDQLKAEQAGQRKS